MQRDLKRLADQTFDLVVIGGGVHGACIAWDAVLRGLSVALIERGDFGQETSANSLKTVHGGLRYLQDADLGLVRSMIRERSTYLRIAPHLVQPLPCLTPTYPSLMKSKVALGVALKFNDLVGFDRNRGIESERALPDGRLLSKRECLRLLPHLPDAGVSGGALWYDAQIYDTERFTLAFVLSAANAGAVVANYVEAIGFIHKQGKVMGVEARDVLNGDLLDIRARVVVNAAGPWVDDLLSRLEPRPEERKFNLSLAVNIITRKFIDGYAAGVPSYPGSAGRSNGESKVSHVLFISPWREYSLVGTFHSHYSGDPDDFQLPDDNLEAILEEINSAYPGADLCREKICFIHHGFLPEIPGNARGEVRLLRRGQIFDHRQEDMEGLVTVVGVKYTSARQLAEKTVDRVFQILGKEAPASMTASVPVYGGQIDQFEVFLDRARIESSGRLSPAAIDHLVRSYGSEFPRLLERLGSSGSQDELTIDSPRLIQAQVEHAVQAEMALKLTDVILRRTGLGSAGKPDRRILEVAAETMAREAGWSADRQAAEIEAVMAVYNRMGL